ncbi:MAG: hypothetical protein MK110_14985 [Fuerstiella sp.]|nr:hypothetical protein [Fuerstiella sp.]
MLSGTSGFVFGADAPAKTEEVKHKDLTLNVPENWSNTGKRNSMRLATYEIPAVKGDKESGELAIFNFPGGGGGVGQNISRWVGQFDSKGREHKITKGKAGDHDYYVVEVSGTYNKSVGPPIRRQTRPVEGSRMLAVILQLNKGVYFLKMTGKDATVKAQSTAFRKSFGGSEKSEEKYKG